MKIKTIIEDRLPKKKIKQPKNKVIVALLMLCETVINQVTPFVLGVYFGITGNTYLFALFVFFLFIQLKIEVNNKNEIKIKILRGI